MATEVQESGTTATFEYNVDGLRIRKTVNGVITNYILHGKNIVHMTQGSDTLHFWYDAQNRPALVQFNNAKYAYIHNLQGDIVGILDSTGTEVVKYTYDAWGKVLSTTGSLASTLGTVQPFRYRGYVYDVETGFYYLRARYYNPIWQRFINADSLIQGNMYSYCKNIATITSDPEGTDIIILIDEDNLTHMSLLIQGWFGVWYYLYWGADNSNGSSAMAINAIFPQKGNGKLIYEGMNINVQKNNLEMTKNELNRILEADYKNEKKFDYSGQYESLSYLTMFSLLSHFRAGELKANQNNLTYNLLSYNCAQLSMDVIARSIAVNDTKYWFNTGELEKDIKSICYGVLPTLIKIFFFIKYPALNESVQ